MSRRSASRSFASALALLAALAIGSLAGVALRPTPSSAADGIPKATFVAAFAGFEGSWERTEPESDDARREAAIDEACTELSWVVRSIAAGVLKSSLMPPDRLAFSVDGEKPALLMGENDKPARPLSFDGRKRSWTDDEGNTYEVSSERLPDGGFRTNFAGDRASGSNVYRITPDGKTLVREANILVRQISGVAPIAFESRFTRSD